MLTQDMEKDWMESRGLGVRKCHLLEKLEPYMNEDGIYDIQKHQSMEEKILDIVEVRDIPVDKYLCADGFKVVTTKRILQILIDNVQSCCETWGYIHTPDNVNHIIGAELYELKNVSTEIADKKLKNLNKRHNLYEPDTCAQFITLFTSKGEVTFTVYNNHNGYYSHGAFIVENGVVIERHSL